MGKHAQRGNGPTGKAWVHTSKCPDWGLNPGPPSYILGALTTKLYGPEYRVLVSDSYQLCDRLLIQQPLQTKMRTLMIPLTSSRLVLLPQLNPHLTDSPSNALMLICGTQLVRKRGRLTDSMALGRSSNYPLAGVQLAPDGS